MRKQHVSFGVAILAVALYGLAGAAEVPDTITIDDCASKQAAVEFPHAAHAELTGCATCHHTQPDLQAGGEAEACSSCHNEPEEAGTPECSQMSLSKNHYHINCVTCHKDELKKDASLSAPTKCTQCHPRG